ncbi:TRAP transporter small permease, partial [Halomonas cupida]|uniref:TRAP transporter small permease n=1 Tax=Halomonas cupida TaxID=44933 RepID=UPI003A93EE2B
VVYITCLGAAAGVRQGTHLSIEMVREAVPAIPRLVMLHLADVFVVLFGVFMCGQGGVMRLEILERASPMIGLSESWRAAPLVVCGVLMVLFSLANILRRGLSSDHATATYSEEEQ